VVAQGGGGKRFAVISFLYSHIFAEGYLDIVFPSWLEPPFLDSAITLRSTLATSDANRGDVVNRTKIYCNVAFGFIQ